MSVELLLERTVFSVCLRLVERARGDVVHEPLPDFVSAVRAAPAKLVAGILGSQVPWETAWAAARGLDQAGLLTRSAAEDRDELFVRVREVLESPLDVPAKGRRFRFPRRGAELVSGALRVVWHSRPFVKHLAACANSNEARAALVVAVPGLGPKQASMLLRDVGLADDQAVLDRHIVRYMQLVGVLVNKNPNLTSLTEYTEHEQALRFHARWVGFPMSIVDVAIWVTMRAAREERIA